MEPSKPEVLANLLNYQDKGIVSRILLKKNAGSVTLFGFDAGQELSEHQTPFDALVQIVEGEAEVRIATHTHRLQAGEALILPANVPHAVKATRRFRMLLTMIRGEE